MTLQSLMAYAPFIGLLYLAFALLQALRKQQQGLFAALLALIALAAPLAALFLVQGAAARASLVNALTFNAVIIFIGSLVIRQLEKRNPARATNRSYGMLGVGLGVLLAAGTFAAPFISTAVVSGATASAADFSTAQTDSTLQTVSNVTAQTDSETSEVVEVLTAQTGLTSDELTTQIESGSTIADLVAAHGGDLDAVITAVASALDDLKTAGGMQAQMLSRMGDDTTAIATQLVNGELDSRAQQFMVRMLVSGDTGFPAAGQAPASGDGTPSAPVAGAGFAPPAAGTMVAPEGFAPPAGDTAAEPTTEPTAIPVSPTATTVRPTQIVFPSPTPTLAATATSIAATQQAVTCAVTINYNLNLREAPNTDSTILLSIPYGSTVMASGRNTDGWYQVSYEGNSGWVSGDYVTPASTCDVLPMVDTE